jgi:hypothetical protein
MPAIFNITINRKKTNKMSSRFEERAILPEFILPDGRIDEFVKDLEDLIINYKIKKYDRSTNLHK